MTYFLNMNMAQSDDNISRNSRVSHSSMCLDDANIMLSRGDKLGKKEVYQSRYR